MRSNWKSTTSILILVIGTLTMPARSLARASSRTVSSIFLELYNTAETVYNVSDNTRNAVKAISKGTCDLSCYPSSETEVYSKLNRFYEILEAYRPPDPPTLPHAPERQELVGDRNTIYGIFTKSLEENMEYERLLGQEMKQIEYLMFYLKSARESMADLRDELARLHDNEAVRALFRDTWGLAALDIDTSVLPALSRSISAATRARTRLTVAKTKLNHRVAGLEARLEEIPSADEAREEHFWRLLYDFIGEDVLTGKVQLPPAEPSAPSHGASQNYQEPRFEPRIDYEYDYATDSGGSGSAEESPRGLDTGYMPAGSNEATIFQDEDGNWWLEHEDGEVVPLEEDDG